MALSGEVGISFQMNEISSPLFVKCCIISDGSLDSITVFKQQCPVKVVAAGLAHEKTVVASFIFAFFGIS